MRQLCLALAFVIASLSAPACGVREPLGSTAVPRRIVAMAPSLTETLVALGLEDRLVGVTRYCPPVPGATDVGGYLDPSYETILALEPDLVLTMQAHEQLEHRLRELGVECFEVDQHDVDGILASVATIAARCAVPERGRALADRLRSQMDGIAQRVAGRERPVTLIVVGREPGRGTIGSFWAAGPDTFYDDILRLAGGRNALADTVVRYPEMSREGLLVMDPEVVFDVIADGGARHVDPQRAAADWMPLVELQAVRSGRVHVLVDDYVVVPGPRVVDTVRMFAEQLHPEVKWP